MAEHRRWLTATDDGWRMVLAAQVELRGRPLACYCGLDKRCHVDNLVDAAEGRLARVR